LESAEQEIRRLNDQNKRDADDFEGKQKEEIKKYQKFIEEKNSVIHSLEKKLQKLEETHNRVIGDLEQKKDELSETLGVLKRSYLNLYIFSLEKRFSLEENSRKSSRT